MCFRHLSVSATQQYGIIVKSLIPARARSTNSQARTRKHTHTHYYSSRPGLANKLDIPAQFREAWKSDILLYQNASMFTSPAPTRLLRPQTAENLCFSFSDLVVNVQIRFALTSWLSTEYSDVSHSSESVVGYFVVHVSNLLKNPQRMAFRLNTDAGNRIPSVDKATQESVSARLPKQWPINSCKKSILILDVFILCFFSPNMLSVEVKSDIKTILLWRFLRHLAVCVPKKDKFDSFCSSSRCENYSTAETPPTSKHFWKIYLKSLPILTKTNTKTCRREVRSKFKHIFNFEISIIAIKYFAGVTITDDVLTNTFISCSASK